MKQLALLTFLTLGLTFSVKAQQVKILQNNYYNTADQMLLANEQNESGEPFAEFLGYNLDDLDPLIRNKPDTISYTLGIESYEYSRYQLGTVNSRSGIGMNLTWGPVLGQMAAKEPQGFDGSFTGGTPNGYNEDDELKKNIKHFGEMAHFTPFKNPFPQFGEYASGDPHLAQPAAPDFLTNFGSLRWDRSKMDKTLSLSQMGQSLMKQYLWAQDMLSAFHDSMGNTIEANGVISPDSTGNPHFDPNNNVYYGGDAIVGFIGPVLLAEGINKTKFVLTQMAYDGNSLGSIDPATYNPANGIKYFPHKIAVTETMVSSSMPPKPTAFNVTDASSNLFDQISYLWGALNMKNMMNPDDRSDAKHLAYKVVFDGDPFPAAASQTGVPGPYDLMTGISKVLFLNIMAMHFNAQMGTLVDSSNLVNGRPVLGNRISTVNAGYALVILAKMKQEFAGTPLEAKATKLINAEAEFLIHHLRDSDGGYFSEYTSGQGVDYLPKDVTSQAAAAHGLYLAYVATNNSKYLKAANQAYNYLIKKFYVPAMHAFRTTQNNDIATYTPRNFAIIAGALRAASMQGGQKDAPIIYARFFIRVGDKMQFNEYQNTGETGHDSDGDGIPFLPEQKDHLAPVWAAVAQLNLHLPAVRDFTLVNEENGKDVQQIMDSSTLDLNNLPPHLNIRANTIPDTVSRVVFILDGKKVRKDKQAPYMLGKEQSYGYGDWGQLPAGDHTLTAVPYEKGNRKGNGDNDGDNKHNGRYKKGTPLTIHFTVIAKKEKTVKSFTLINALTNKDIQPLTDGSVIDLSKVGALLNIKANTDPSDSGSVVFILDGRTIRTDNSNAYTLAPQNPYGYFSFLVYYAWHTPLGDHTLTAIPYLNGNQGEPLTIHFKVVAGSQSPYVESKPASANTSPSTDKVVSISLYPNPAHGMLNITIKGLQPNVGSNLFIETISGGTVKKIRINNSNQLMQINISRLRPGTYFIKMMSGDKVMYKKFEKM